LSKAIVQAVADGSVTPGGIRVFRYGRFRVWVDETTGSYTVGTVHPVDHLSTMFDVMTDPSALLWMATSTANFGRSGTATGFGHIGGLIIRLSPDNPELQFQVRWPWRTICVTRPEAVRLADMMGRALKHIIDIHTKAN